MTYVIIAGALFAIVAVWAAVTAFTLIDIDKVTYIPNEDGGVWEEKTLDTVQPYEVVIVAVMRNPGITQ